MQNAIETIRQHRTYRHFKAGLSLPESDVQTIIDCARQAPSWMNGQHYSIINITDPALRAQIVALQPGNPQIGTCSTYLLFIADLHRAGLASQACQGSFNAAGEPDSLITAVTDTSLAAQNALVAAESLGYATCFTGGIRLIAPQLIELLGLPANTSRFSASASAHPTLKWRSSRACQKAACMPKTIIRQSKPLSKIWRNTSKP